MLPFWMSVAGYPFIIIILGSLIRFYKGAPLPCSTDMLGLLAGVDIIALQAPASLLEFTGIAGNKTDLVSINLMLIVFDLVAWVVCLLEVEPKLIEWYNEKDEESSGFPAKQFAFAWGVFVILLLIHIGVFAGKIMI